MPFGPNFFAIPPGISPKNFLAIKASPPAIKVCWSLRAKPTLVVRACYLMTTRCKRISGVTKQDTEKNIRHFTEQIDLRTTFTTSKNSVLCSRLWLCRIWILWSTNILCETTDSDSRKGTAEIACFIEFIWRSCLHENFQIKFRAKNLKKKHFFSGLWNIFFQNSWFTPRFSKPETFRSTRRYLYEIFRYCETEKNVIFEIPLLWFSEINAPGTWTSPTLSCFLLVSISN